MPVRHSAKKVVYRHASDDQAHDCGRACAQMIISSLVLGVPAPSKPSPTLAAKRVPVRQDELHRRETWKNDVPGRWFTHPDELADLLNGNADLQAAGLTGWRVAANDSFDELLKEVAASLKLGFPAVLNIRASDHWVVVHGVDLHASGYVSYLRMLDPLLKHTAPAYDKHTYLDGCATDGTTWWSTINRPASVIAKWDVPVGPLPPTNYAGKCVAVVMGSEVDDRADWQALRLQLERTQPGPRGATPEQRIRHELARVSIELEAPELVELAAVTPVVRHVHDIDARQRGYTIASWSRAFTRQGMLGIFDLDDQRFLQLRLTEDEALIRSIDGDPSELLWWTSRPLETLFSPYFPFVKKGSGTEARYERLIDGFTIEPPAGRQA
ncbi:MAG: hypothetical protein R2745_19515 [Vicinamibacterales bacterium]